ncbi:MAG: CoA transferase [Proteobacteria bacterium]|nr:CoA transferase [Pseudomonadota bacterium]
MPLLTGLVILQIGPGLAAAVCGRAFADLGAEVRCLGAQRATPICAYLNHGKPDTGSDINPRAVEDGAKTASVIICEGPPNLLQKNGIDPTSLRALNSNAVIVAISPFGQTGPRADDPASDLTLLAASGIARMLTGQVDDISEPPTRAVGEQSAFIGGLAAACAGMHGVLTGKAGIIVDVSIHEALALLAIGELTRASLTSKVKSRKRLTDGNGATVTILPVTDGYVAISPRQEQQWTAWVSVMRAPAWANEPRFATKPDRVKNWDALHALMSDWSRTQKKQSIADAAQAAHVPSFPLREPVEQLGSEQLRQRNFYRPFEWNGTTFKVPGPPYGLAEDNDERGSQMPTGPCTLPLSGIRVLDFSWVIAGPTTTRYLAAMGAEVIKVEAPGPGDPSRTSELHTILGQAKQGIVLNLKDPEAAAIARALAAQSDILIENFGTGVMERFGLGAEELRRENPGLIYISASGMGRTGPEAKAVAYGTLLQCYAGFAGLNRQPGMPPRVGMAWLDPMCGLKLAFGAAAAIWNRGRTGHGARIDFSMVEAMLWTMAESILKAQQGVPLEPSGNASETFSPHEIYPAKGDDAWVAIAVTTDAEWQALCAIVPGMLDWSRDDVEARRARGAEINRAVSDWSQTQSADSAAAQLISAGIPAAFVASMLDLVECEHLRKRKFWERSDGGHLPGLPWQASFGRQNGPAPGLGADTDAVLSRVLGMTTEEIEALRKKGALG